MCDYKCDECDREYCEGIDINTAMASLSEYEAGLGRNLIDFQRDIMTPLQVKVKLLTNDEINALDLTTKEDRDTLILSFVPIASNIAQGYSNMPEIDYDDIQAEAILGIVEAVNRVADKKNVNIGGYIYKYIQQYCFSFLKKFSRYNKPDTQVLQDIPDSCSFSMFLFYDCLDTIAKTDTEKLILKLREEGFNDTEIQQKTGILRKDVRKTRELLFNRFMKLWI